LEEVLGAYSLFVDGSRVIGPIASGLRPQAIWIGHPDFVSFAPPHNWTAFTLDSIRVSEFNQPGAVITLTKSLVPASDSGRFNLKVGSRVVKAGAGNSDSGSIRVAAGSYTVTESAVPGSP